MQSPSDRLASALADRYRLERELGAGGMATVYLAHDVRHDRKVAIKVLKPELAAVLGADRFVVEIKTTAALSHPHILPLFDSGTADGFLYYVMPFIKGETIREKLNRETQFGVEEAVRIAREVADALDYAHRNGVIHRDIKPENILLHDGRAMVMDFGIALAVSAAAGGRMTETGLSLGTPHYMSPEQATADKEITGRSDIYSLASVLYEMLSGDPPHTGSSAQQVIMKIITDTPRPLSELRRNAPTNVVAALAKGLEKLPSDRFESASAFAQALGNPSFGFDGAAGSASLAPPARQSRVVFALSAVAVLAMVIAVRGWTRPTPARPVARYYLGLPDSLPVQGTWARVAAARDGQRFVYRSGPGPEATYPLWVRERDNLSSSRLAGTEGAVSPFVSYDGRSVGYFSSNALWSVPVGGGAPTMITSETVGQYGGSWSPDDIIYFDGTGPSGLLAVRAVASSTPTAFTRLDASANESDHVFPEVLPNGKGVIFVVRRGAYDTWEIAVADRKTGNHRRLTRGVYARYASSGHLLIVTASGALTAVRFDQESMELLGSPVALNETVGLRGYARVPDMVISDQGTLIYGRDPSPPGGGAGEPMWVERDGRARPVAPGWTNNARFPALSPDGRQLALSIEEGSDNLQVWVRQLDAGTTKKITHEGAINWRPAWRDDHTILYLGDRRKSGEVFIRRLDSAGEDSVLLSRPSEISEAQTTVDGHWIVYREGANAVSDLYAKSTAGDTVTVALAASKFQERNPAVSPDGKLLAYASDETGRIEIYVQRFPNATDGKTLVSTSGGMNPLWSRDGRELFYRNDHGDLVAVEVTGGTSIVGRQRVLFSALPYIFASPHGSYDVARDGRFLMIRRVFDPDRANTAPIVVDNFFEELRRKVPQ